MPSAQPPQVSVPAPDMSEDLSHQDIWGGEADYQHTNSASSNNEEILSDLPSLRRQHMTDGYREGLSAGKGQVMQRGFDEGYPIGVRMALRVGKILGILEGYLACKSVLLIPGMKDLVQQTYKQARSDLNIKALLNNIDETELESLQKIPQRVETVISTWEGTVMAVWLTRKHTLSLDHEEKHGLRDLVAENTNTGNPLPTHDDVIHQLTVTKAQQEVKTGDDTVAGDLTEGWQGRRQTYW